jgi:hypothetical protein
MGRNIKIKIKTNKPLKWVVGFYFALFRLRALGFMMVHCDVGVWALARMVVLLLALVVLVARAGAALKLRDSAADSAAHAPQVFRSYSPP